MVDTVNAVGGTVATTNVGLQFARVPASSDNNTNSSDNTSKAQDITLSQIPTISARLYSDPVAGVLVTDQVDTSGKIISESPSSSVLSYLRNGLSIDGHPKQSETA